MLGNLAATAAARPQMPQGMPQGGPSIGAAQNQMGMQQANAAAQANAAKSQQGFSAAMAQNQSANAQTQNQASNAQNQQGFNSAMQGQAAQPNTLQHLRTPDENVWR